MEKSKINFNPEQEILKNLKTQTAQLIKLLKKSAKKNKVKIDIFIGGSYAKETLVKKDLYDVDVFIRLEKKTFEKDISRINKIASEVAKEIGGELKEMHGSRDYYQISFEGKPILFEIIPVLKIKKPEEAENVTDLSYFHVNFIKRKLNSENLKKQVRLAKAFTAACDTYGAESYIQGFSGYALECLIVHYKSLDRMLRELGNAKETVVIDSERHYKNKKEILIQLNESKLQSPVIVIDPTWKKRNALASLNRESFERFQLHARNYLKNKSPKYFEVKTVSHEELTTKAAKLNQELIVIELTTDKQEGDIAGTKLKKVSRYIEQQLSKEFDIKETKFVYNGEREAKLYIIGKPKKEILLSGPPTSMLEHAQAFRKEHTAVFEKKGKLYAKKQVSQSMKQYFNEKVANDVNLGLMSVTKVRVISY